MRPGVAQFLGIPREKVRVVWMQGPQAYGRTAAEDAGFEAAFLASVLPANQATAPRVLWDAATIETQMPTVAHDAVMADDAALMQWLELT